MTDAIELASAKYEEGKTGAKEFKEVLDAAISLSNNPDATTEQLSAEIKILSDAVFTFCVSNPKTGIWTAPENTYTHPYNLTGSTEAIFRATASTKDIMESGVCWSMQHEPTVFDNRSTESHELRGKLYHIRNLSPATVYYVRPYAVNKGYEVAYGDEIKIVTHPKGTCVGKWNEGAPDEAANTRCRNAIQQTIEYFNQWTGIKGFTLSGSYGSGTPTADCSYGGSMRIGPNAGNQAIGTVIHETGHGVGVGTSGRWSDKNVHDWKWFGREANKIYSFLENKEADPYINTEDYFCMVGDGMHGWGHNSTYDWFVNGSDKDKHIWFEDLLVICLFT